MKIARLEIRDVRGINRLELDLLERDGLPRRRCVLLGVNGGGKSTVLEAVRHLVEGCAIGDATRLGPAAVRRTPPSLLQRPPTQGLVRADVLLNQTTLESEPVFDVLSPWCTAERLVGVPAQTQVVAAPEMRTWEGVDILGDAPAHEPEREGERELERIRKAMYVTYQAAMAADLSRPASTLLYIGPKRETTVGSLPVDALVVLSDALLAGEAAAASAVDRINKVASAYLDGFPVVSAVGGRWRFTNRRGVEGITLEELSDGERAAFVLLVCVVWVGPPEGLILIDEPEQHLHPAWQSGIVGALGACHPRAQFIFATQAPYLATVLQDGLYEVAVP